MRLTHLTIKNFKGLDERGARLDFAPVTMLFGPNNAGKSTVIQALHLAREVLGRGNPDPDRVEGGGESINLGGFKSFVHRHNLDNQVTIGLGLNLESEDLPLIYEQNDMKFQSMMNLSLNIQKALPALAGPTVSQVKEIFDRDENDEERQKFIKIVKELVGIFPHMYPEEFLTYANRVINRIRKFEVRFSISWGKAGKKPFVSQYEVHINGVRVGALSCAENARPAFSGLDFSGLFTPEEKEELKNGFQAFLDSKHEEGLKGDFQAWSGSKDYRAGDRPQLNLIRRLDGLIDNSATWEAIVPGSIGREGGKPDTPEILDRLDRGSALPLWSSAPDPYFYKSDIDIRSRFFFSIMVGPGLKLNEFFHNQFQYIGPWRQIPPRNFTAAKTAAPDQWANGLGAWDVLTAADSAELEAVNRWLDGPESLNTGYAVHNIKFIPVSAEDDASLKPLLKEVLKNSNKKAASRLNWILRKPRETRLFIYNKKLGLNMSPNDIGAGISQIIPVIVAGALAAPDAFIAVEQPELHIHPAGQTVLGDIFLRAVDPRDKRHPMFLLETHSEHLMLRLLRRLRETFENKLPEDFPPVKPKAISVFYVQAKEGGGTEITPLPVTSEGDFDRKWPNGFFSEREEELFG